MDTSIRTNISYINLRVHPNSFLVTEIGAFWCMVLFFGRLAPSYCPSRADTQFLIKSIQSRKVARVRGIYATSPWTARLLGALGTICPLYLLKRSTRRSQLQTPKGSECSVDPGWLESHWGLKLLVIYAIKTTVLTTVVASMSWFCGIYGGQPISVIRLASRRLGNLSSCSLKSNLWVRSHWEHIVLAEIFSWKRNGQRKARERAFGTLDEYRRALGMLNPMPEKIKARAGGEWTTPVTTVCPEYIVEGRTS